MICKFLTHFSRSLSRPCTLSLSKGVEGCRREGEEQGGNQDILASRKFAKKHLSTEKYSVLICNFGTLKNIQLCHR